MQQPNIDRRKQQRRREVNEAADGLYINRRDSDRRQAARRACPRVIYPLKTAPQVLNMRAQVVGISTKAVRFFFSDFDPQMTDLEQGKRIRIALKFHDGCIVEKAGVILRQDKYLEDKDHFVCLFDEELTAERIETERTYLLKKLPEVSSEESWNSPPILFFE